jgi:hypothetical protein
MPDISMCNGVGCKLKNRCYRFKAIPSDYQSYFSIAPVNEDGTCDYLWKINSSDRSKKYKNGKQ